MTIKQIKAETPAPGLTVDEAKTELKAKTKSQIEIETAYKWGSRAIAAIQMGKLESDIEAYKQEALEHAALAEDDFKTLRIIDAEIKKAK
jgi:hypothetical protein